MAIKKTDNASRCSAVGSAHGLGPWCRRFESYHLDHKKHCTIWYGAFYFVWADVDSTYLQALLESGSPNEQSREVFAHQRLRSVTSNLLRSHPIISTIKTTYSFEWVVFIFEIMEGWEPLWLFNLYNIFLILIQKWKYYSPLTS